ncbi:MAG: type II toxin-antitoxin system PemK/MazF family toxin [Desulfosarcina sp.]|nr:type II toxin-antitoxin system PemK/MazF family toxin [Desulfobacterales bacterium]
MMKYQPGQIWIVNFDPSIGHEYKKVRPALVVQHDRYISSGSLLTVIPVSSQVAKCTELDVILEKNDQNRLMKNSLLKTKQISSFDKKRFLKFIGTLDEQTMKTVDNNIQLFFFGT